MDLLESIRALRDAEVGAAALALGSAGGIDLMGGDPMQAALAVADIEQDIASAIAAASDEELLDAYRRAPADPDDPDRASLAAALSARGLVRDDG